MGRVSLKIRPTEPKLCGMPLQPELLQEHAYLVARGVREVAEVGTVPVDRASCLRAATILEDAAPPGAIAFVVPLGGRAVCGFAAHEWAIDLYEWANTADIPQAMRARILGLLHGYSGEAIRDFEARECGRRWLPSSSESDERESS